MKLKPRYKNLLITVKTEIKELEVKREEAFDKLKEKNYEHYI